jgi:hypothetical protein
MTIEAKIDVWSTPQKDVLNWNFTLPPHGACRLHDIQEEHDPFSTWGKSVETLWQVAMNFDIKPCSWDALTTRVFTWRCIVGTDKSSVGEWARISVLQSLDNGRVLGLKMVDVGGVTTTPGPRCNAGC